MLIVNAFKIFMDEKKINGFTSKTLDFYNDSAGSFVRYCIEQHKGEVNVDEIQQYVAPYFIAAQERGTSATTRHTYLRGIKTFTRFLHAEEYIDRPIKLPKVRCPTTYVKALSTDQMRKLLSFFSTDRFTGVRNKMIVRVMCDTGLRLQEVCGLYTTDVDLTEGFLLVRHGKGQKERSVPFGKKTRAALWQYLKQRERHARPQHKELFITTSGAPLKGRSVQIMFKRLRKRVKFEDIRLSPHTLRHSFALAYIENGGDPFSLQKILGHTTQTMTAKYVNMAKSNVKYQHEKFSVGNDI